MLYCSMEPEFATKQEGLKYLIGVCYGLKEFAWWKDGIEYVGTCGKTLIEAKGEFEERIKRIEEELGISVY